MADIRVTVRIDKAALIGLLSGEGVQRRMGAAASSALKLQKALVPVDTGHLSEHLEIRPTTDGLGRQVGAFDVDYAAAVELGHQTTSGTWVPAQPFVRPSLDAVRKGLSNG